MLPNLYPYHQLKPYSSPQAGIRFSSSATLTEPHQLLASQTHQALNDMVGTHDEPLDTITLFVNQIVNGNPEYIKLLKKSLDSFDKKDTQTGFEQKTGGIEVTYGIKKKVFSKRENLHCAETQSFTDLLYDKFYSDNDRRLIIAITGWTNPPVKPFLQDQQLSTDLQILPEKEQLKEVDMIYQTCVYDFLDEVIRTLTSYFSDKPRKFNPSKDIGIIYGVTESGVDEAVRRFCNDKKIPIVGLTCYPWMEYIPDEAGRPPVFIAKDTKEFKKLMYNTPHYFIITGGRGYANAPAKAGRERRIPVDVVKAYSEDHIEIPAVAENEEGTDVVIQNAAALIKALGHNPFEQEKIKDASRKQDYEHRDVFAAIQILKQHLNYNYRLARSRKALRTATE